MQIDKYTDFGLRILIILAINAPQRVSARRIADIFDISEHHLAKVGSDLARGGFIFSERGRTGGLTLARDPRDINIGAVMRYLKGKTPVVECFGSGSRCCIIPACGLRAPLQKAQEMFYQCLDAYSLQDIVQDKEGLRRLTA